MLVSKSCFWNDWKGADVFPWTTHNFGTQSSNAVGSTGQTEHSQVYQISKWHRVMENQLDMALCGNGDSPQFDISSLSLSLSLSSSSSLSSPSSSSSSSSSSFSAWKMDKLELSPPCSTHGTLRLAGSQVKPDSAQVAVRKAPSCARFRAFPGREKRELILTMVLCYVGMDQYLLIPFLGGWTSIYQLFWCSPGVQDFDTLPCNYPIYENDLLSNDYSRGFAICLASLTILQTVQWKTECPKRAYGVLVGTSGTTSIFASW